MSGEEIIQISQSFMALQLPHYSYLDPAQDCERAKQFYLNMFKKCSFFKSKMVAISMSSTVTTDFQDMFPFGNWWMIPVPLIMTNKLLFVWWFTRQMSIMGMTNAPFKFKGCPAAHNGKEFVSLLCRLVHGYRTKANLLLQLVSLLTEYECRQAGLPMVLMESVCRGKQVPAYSRNKPYGDYCGTYHYQPQLCLLSEFWNLFCQVIFTEKHLVFNMV